MFEQLISPGTIVTIIIGLVIAYFYLHYMWGALRKSIRTRNDPDGGPSDRYRFSLVGAVLSVIVSILSIAVFGAGPIFLYWGPVLALVAAGLVAFALRDEVNSED